MASQHAELDAFAARAKKLGLVENMLLETQPALLDHLHDARCSSFGWDCGDPSTRRVWIVAHVGNEGEYEPWKGKTVSITLFDVVVCRFVGWGYQSGIETLDAYRDAVSPEFSRECDRLRDLGIEIPPLMFTIVFGSGSAIEVACREVMVEPAASG